MHQRAALSMERRQSVKSTKNILMTGAAFVSAALTSLVFLVSARADASGPRLDAEKIASAAGSKTTTTPDGIVRISWPRTEVPVKVDGMPLKPFAGLGAWAAFTPSPHGAM